jgi:hypothetical protein
VAGVQTSEVGPKFAPEAWDDEILDADRSSKDERLSKTPLSGNTKNTNMADGWKLKFASCFMGTTHLSLHLNEVYEPG